MQFGFPRPAFNQAAIDRLVELERAIDRARVAASRAGEPEIDEQLGELHLAVVERRRRALRSS